MQDDPEAILRNNRRQAASTANRQRRHSNTGGLTLPQEPDAATSPGDDAGTLIGTDGQRGNGADEAAAQDGPGQDAPHSSEGRPQDDGSTSNAAHTGEQADDHGIGANQDSASGHTETGAGSTAPNTNQNTSPNNGATSTTAPATSPGRGSETHELNSPGHDLDTGERQGPRPPGRQQNPTDGAAAGSDLGGEPPGRTACQRFRASLEAFQAAATAEGPPALDDDVNIRFGRRLPIDAIHVAIGSVSEAISERDETSFSLVDRVTATQPAARSGRPLLWPFHRARTNYRGGHFSLLVIEESDSQPPGVTVEHRDSWPALRQHANVDQVWQREIRPSLAATGVFEWDTTGALGQNTIPVVVTFPEGQYDQTHNWTCGLCTIINAWIYALGLTHAVAARPRMTEAFARDACTIADLAMRGFMDSATIRDFLECHAFVDPGSQVGNGRTFDRTVQLSSSDALTQRVRRVRLQEGIARRREADGEDYPSLDDMLLMIADTFGPTDPFQSIDDLLGAYATTQAASTAPDQNSGSGDAGETEDDAAMALRIQNEEFLRDATQRQQDPTNEELQRPTGGSALQDNVEARRDNEAAGQARQDTDGQQQQQTNTSIQESNSPSGQDVPEEGAPQQPANATGQANVSEQEQSNDSRIEQAMERPGEEENVGSNLQSDQPLADSGSAAGVEDEEERRRQRAYALLRPAHDPFRPGAPIRAPSATVERAAREGVSELSMLVSQYSNSPRHQKIRERFGLPDWTGTFAAATQQQRELVEQSGAPAAVQQPTTLAADAAQDGQPDTSTPAAAADAAQDAPAATTPNAQRSNEAPHAPTAGVPAIPGLQSTIPAASPSPPPQPDATAAAASAGTNNAQAAAPTQRGSSESANSLRSYEYYEREEQREEAARQAARDREHEQQLQQSREEFERETGERRQRGREDGDGEEGGTGGDLDSLFDGDVDGASSATEGDDQEESLG